MCRRQGFEQAAETHASAAVRTHEKAKDFILRNLADHELNGNLVTAHCQVSDRYLRAVFAPTHTIADFIRKARLRRRRDAMCDPTLAGRAAAAIAQAWRFTDPASYNRIFKARFGHMPGEIRAAAGAR